MSVLAGLVTGLLGVRLLRVFTDQAFRHQALARENYRGRRVPSGAGVLIVLTVLMVEAGRVVVGAVIEQGTVPSTSLPRTLVLVAALGFGLLGLWDDLLGDSHDSGFRGHLRALAAGRLTTGGIKLVGGGALALVVVAPVAADALRWLVADALVVALAANLANLLDRAPGRMLKVGLLAYLPLMLTAGAGAVGAAIAPVVGAAAGLLPDDLRERAMLGDCGANVVGGCLGLGAVLTLGSVGIVVLLGVLVALNLASEAVSFSRVIERVDVLRALDQAGRDVTWDDTQA